MKPGTSSVDTLYFFAFSRVTSAIRSAIRMSLTNSRLREASIDTPPQFIPPSRLGHSM